MLSDEIGPGGASRYRCSMKDGPQGCRGPDIVGALVKPDPLVQGVALGGPCRGSGKREQVVAMGVQ